MSTATPPVNLTAALIASQYNQVAFMTAEQFDAALLTVARLPAKHLAAAWDAMGYRGRATRRLLRWAFTERRGAYLRAQLLEPAQNDQPLSTR